MALVSLKNNSNNEIHASTRYQLRSPMGPGTVLTSEDTKMMETNSQPPPTETDAQERSGTIPRGELWSS